MNGPFAPNHTVPEGGLAAYAQPDPNAAPVARLDPRLDVEVRRNWGAWAEIVCSNGWTAWVDARYLVPRGALGASPPISPPAPAPYPGAVPASTAPGGHAATPAQAPAARPVGAPAPATAGASRVPTVALVGAAAAFVGSFVSWVRDAGSVEYTGHDVPLQFLFDPQTTSSGPIKVGALIVIVAIAGAVFAALPNQARWQRTCGGGLVALTTMYFASVQRLLSDASASDGLFDFVGFGVYVCLAGGLVLALAPGARK